MDDPVLTAREGAVATLVLNRPERRNPLSLETITALRGALAAAAADPAARVVVIGATGPAFSAGHDLREMTDRDAAFHETLFGACAALMNEIHDLPLPVVARVQGIATAAGCQLVAACDLAVAARSARFATPGVRIGLFCTTPMVEVARVVGRRRALEMLLTGDPVDAATAADWGLVNRVVPDEELETATRALAEGLAAHSPRVLAAGKRAFHETMDLGLGEAYRHASERMCRDALTDDAREGFSAFLGKLPPVWAPRDPEGR